METTLPPIVFYVAGAIVLTNVGTILSIFYFALKSAWFLSKMDSRIDDSKNSSIRAHKRIDKLEKRFEGGTESE